MTIRVAICEDSNAYAHGLRRLLEEGGQFAVVMIANDAEALLRDLPQVAVDLVTMDLELPGLDGAEAIRRIMRRHPVPIVVLSAHAGRSGLLVAEALAAGALEVIPKADVQLGGRGGAAAAALRRRLVRLAEHPRQVPALPPSLVGVGARADDRRPAVGDAPSAPTSTVGLVSSTGGPGALRTVLAALPATYPLPVLLVQHIGTGFTEGLVDWLRGVLSVPVRLARHGEPAGRGVVVAPAGQDLRLGLDLRLQLDSTGAPSPYRPSGDVLLTSIAAAVGHRGLGVVLTGMGRDGAEGVAELVRVGGAAWAQPPGESAVWGMPAAAVEAGAEPRTLVAIGVALAALSSRRST